MYGRFGLGGLLPLCLQLVVGLVCLKGCGGKLLFFHHATSAATVVILAVTSCSTIWLSMGKAEDAPPAAWNRLQGSNLPLPVLETGALPT